MYLVTQGRGRVNQLGYLSRTHEYVYIHKGKEIWREKGDDSLFNYFNAVRGGMSFDEEAINEMPTLPIWERYAKSCHDFEVAEHPEIYGFRR